MGRAARNVRLGRAGGAAAKITSAQLLGWRCGLQWGGGDFGSECARTAARTDGGRAESISVDEKWMELALLVLFAV